MSAAPVAIVTGAAGGIGSAIVRRLLDRGYRVVASDVSERVAELAGDDPRVAALVADAADSVSARDAVALAVDRFGALDLLVNNAARFLSKPITETTDEEFDELMAINARGCFVHSRAAVPALRASRGCIVNLASTSGFVGVVGQSVYAMTKGAIVQHTRQLAIELAPSGVRVNAVAPGAVDTAFAAAARAAEPDPEAAARASLARHPLGRISTPDDVAGAVEYLAGATGVTGTILNVDGGYLAQ